jgi:hypothetical protein
MVEARLSRWTSCGVPRTAISAGVAPASAASKAPSGAIEFSLIVGVSSSGSFVDWGAWRFRGLPEPVDLFQVEAADLLADFPPPRFATPAQTALGRRATDATCAASRLIDRDCRQALEFDRDAGSICCSSTA